MGDMRSFYPKVPSEGILAGLPSGGRDLLSVQGTQSGSASYFSAYLCMRIFPYPLAE